MGDAVGMGGQAGRSARRRCNVVKAHLTLQLAAGGEPPKPPPSLRSLQTPFPRFAGEGPGMGASCGGTRVSSEGKAPRATKTKRKLPHLYGQLAWQTSRAEGSVGLPAPP